VWPGGYWREVHALYWDEKRARLAFGVLYLFTPEERLELQYSLSLPDLDAPGANMPFGATWTTP
jgi:hypothetical protein